MISQDGFTYYDKSTAITITEPRDLSPEEKTVSQERMTSKIKVWRSIWAIDHVIT